MLINMLHAILAKNKPETRNLALEASVQEGHFIPSDSCFRFNSHEYHQGDRKFLIRPSEFEVLQALSFFYCQMKHPIPHQKPCSSHPVQTITRNKSILRTEHLAVLLMGIANRRSCTHTAGVAAFAHCQKASSAFINPSVLFLTTSTPISWFIYWIHGPLLIPLVLQPQQKKIKKFLNIHLFLKNLIGRQMDLWKNHWKTLASIQNVFLNYNTRNLLSR